MPHQSVVVVADEVAVTGFLVQQLPILTGEGSAIGHAEELVLVGFWLEEAHSESAVGSDVIVEVIERFWVEQREVAIAGLYQLHWLGGVWLNR